MGQPPDLCASIIDAIGDTPLVELRRTVASRGLEGRLLTKLEHLNPGFSKKDRIALEMIRDARGNGTLRPGQTVVELTSGNTGTGLAMVCRSFGHPFVAVMSRGNTVERARMMIALGAEVVLVDQAGPVRPGRVGGDDLAMVERRTQLIVEQRDAFRCDQFRLESNLLAHERHTGPELWEQCGGRLDAFVDFVGTGGTFTGVMRYVGRQNPEVRGYVVEPASAAVLAGMTNTCASHRIQGGGYSKTCLPLLDRNLVHGCVQVSDDEAIAAARALAREEGLVAGFSTGANVAAAIKLLRGPHRGQCVAFLTCDSGLKYMSTDLY